MTDILLLIGIIAAYFAALALMPKFSKKPVVAKFKPIEQGESGTYDPSEDPEKVMKGEVESYFD
jgi:hypothetical protein